MSKFHDTEECERRAYIAELEQFIVDNVDPSYFDEEGEDFKFWTAICKKYYPENY